MLANTAAGFHNTPFTKGVLIFVGISSLLSQIFKSQSRYDLVYEKLARHQFYRIATSNINFCTSSELFLGTLLLYNFRILERHYGTVKYASLSMLSIVLGSFINVILLAFGHKYVSRLASGPFGLVMSLSVFYSFEIPTSYHIKIFGFKVSDHIFLSTILLQFSILSGFTSIFPSLTGLLAGLAVSQLQPLNDWRIPPFITSLSSTYLLPFLQSGRKASSLSTHTSPMAERQARNNSADASGSGQSEEASTNQEDIVLLESMGFQRERIIEALQMNGNDVNRAIAFLLG